MSNFDPRTAAVTILVFALVVFVILRKVPVVRTIVTVGVALGLAIGIASTMLAGAS